MTRKIVTVGVVGSRSRNSMDDVDILFEAADNIIETAKKKNVEVRFVSGGCKKGADAIIKSFAQDLNWNFYEHLPDESKLPKNPSRNDWTKIFYERNIKIVNDSDFIVAMVSKDRKGGTEHTIEQAKKKGITVIII